MTSSSTATPNIHVVHWSGLRAEANGMAAAIAANIARNPEDKHLIMVTRRKLGYMVRDALVRIDPELVVNMNFSEGLLEAWAAREAFIFLSVYLVPDRAGWRSWLGYKDALDGLNFKAPQRNSPAYLNLLSRASDNITEAVVEAVAAGRVQVNGAGRSNIIERARRYLALREQFEQYLDDPEQFIDEVFKLDHWQVDTR